MTTEQVNFSKEVYNYLTSKGVSPTHAKGMLANIAKESMFNPSVGQDFTGKESLGLFQYTGNRAQGLKTSKPNWSSNWQDQIDYALSEGITSKYLSQKFSSPEEASRWFTKNWEIPANKDQEAEERLGYLSNFRY
jgi:hypothetical protein